MSDAIQSVSMPKWGMTMTTGRLLAWLVEEGDEVAIGDEVAEVETDKLTSAVEAQVAGTLRRRVAEPGDVVPVGGILGVLAPPSVTDEEVQAFVDAAPKSVASDDDEDGEATSSTVSGSLGPIHVLSRGEHPETVVLLHGFGGDALNWRFNIEELAQQRTVLAVDLPGHGESTKDVGAGSADDLASAVVEVLDAMGVARAHLVGHSLGGVVAATVAGRHPERVASLALIAPAGLGEQIDAEFVDGFVAASSRREVKPILRMLFADERMVTRELVEDVLRYKRLEGVAEALGVLRDCLFPAGRQRVSIVRELADCESPVLVVWGGRDVVTPAEQAAAAPSDAQVRVIAGAGHSPHVEAAPELNRLLTEFLAASAVADTREA